MATLVCLLGVRQLHDMAAEVTAAGGAGLSFATAVCRRPFGLPDTTAPAAKVAHP